MANERQLTYGKLDGKMEEFQPPKAEETFDMPDSLASQGLIVQQDQPRGYTKVDGELSYGIVCVISGGTVRERDFLKEIEKKRTFKSLDVVFVSTSKEGGGLTPKMMQKKYDEICSDSKLEVNGRTIELESVDSVYMFTDVDHYIDELREIVSTQHRGLPKWIISNPDFEIWLYYCFFNNPDNDLVVVTKAEESKRSSMLKTINGTFNNGGGLDPRKAFDKMKDGISNSRAHYKETDGIPDLLSTQMYIFAEEVIEKLGDEYDTYLKIKNMDWRNRLKENNIKRRK